MQNLGRGGGGETKSIMVFSDSANMRTCFVVMRSIKRFHLSSHATFQICTEI